MGKWGWGTSPHPYHHFNIIVGKMGKWGWGGVPPSPSPFQFGDDFHPHPSPFPHFPPKKFLQMGMGMRGIGAPGKNVHLYTAPCNFISNMDLMVVWCGFDCCRKRRNLSLG